MTPIVISRIHLDHLRDCLYLSILCLPEGISGPWSPSFEISNYLCAFKCRCWPLSSRQAGAFQRPTLSSVHFHGYLFFLFLFQLIVFEETSRELAKITEPCWLVILGSRESTWLIIAFKCACPVYSVHHCMILHRACPGEFLGFSFVFPYKH